MRSRDTPPRVRGGIRKSGCGRCGYRQFRCQCGASQRPAEFRADMRLVRDDHGLPVLVPGLIEPFKYMCSCGGYVTQYVEEFGDHLAEHRDDTMHYNVAPWAVAEREAA